jgi:hypothetical protein
MSKYGGIMEKRRGINLVGLYEKLNLLLDQGSLFLGDLLQRKGINSRSPARPLRQKRNTARWWKHPGVETGR